MHTINFFPESNSSLLIQLLQKKQVWHIIVIIAIDAVVDEWFE